MKTAISKKYYGLTYKGRLVTASEGDAPLMFKTRRQAEEMRSDWEYTDKVKVVAFDLVRLPSEAH
jgi:hypothetical protein